MDKRGPLFGQSIDAKKSYNEQEKMTENMYTVNVRVGLEAEKELLPNPTDTVAR